LAVLRSSTSTVALESIADAFSAIDHIGLRSYARFVAALLLRRWIRITASALAPRGQQNIAIDYSPFAPTGSCTNPSAMDNQAGQIMVNSAGSVVQHTALPILFGVDHHRQLRRHGGEEKYGHSSSIALPT
jgi:hypothetical protein